ncbi:CoA pyrophosphatase [Sediminibacter sp. Hel_I_10]|uniref:NUDIX hydrolase n=1 Tax=Sediminibacter sp. Hel_I_10 TaxID=1392490 RepID=UPI00047D2A53|nr:CoA pyrophosphatase [Sediminibacter sp. Hel_I_10]
MDFTTFKETISKIINLELLGESSQFKMSPPFRKELIDENRAAMKTAKRAGVMALFYPNYNHETHLILILRKTYKGVHSAQVGFPGGKFESSDPSLEYTALRETEEEIGVPVQDISVIKAMSPLYIPPSNFTVAPFIGITQATPKFVKQDSEVEELIEVKLSDFLNENSTTEVSVMTSMKKELNVPAFKLNGYTVWGATAMMLSEVKDLLKMVF